MNQIQKNQFKNFILYIIGTTAAGKTKLSLSVGDKFQGEVVSCDSMQIYKKCDVMTAKATEKEQSIVKHHMLSVLELNESNFNRNEYFHKSYDIAQQLQNNNKIPIIVGGTHYYIETLMFDQKIHKKQLQQSQNDFQQDRNTHKILDGLTSRQLFEKLQELDPLLANKTHPNNRKRVKQYLNIILSRDTEEQDQQNKTLSSEMENHMKIPLRNENCLVFWPRPKEREMLKQQQMKRIREMVNEDQGLEEALQIIEELIGNEIQIDENFDPLNDKFQNEDSLLQRGVLQSIGYKEFLPVYKFIKKQFKIINQENLKQIIDYIQQNEQPKQILEQCIERLYFNTVHMSKKQIQWIRHRIITNSDSQQIKKRMYVFDFDEYSSENFNQNVVQPALQVTQKYLELLENHDVEDALDKLNQDENLAKYLIQQEEIDEIYKTHNKEKSLEEWENFYCKECELELRGKQQYETHMASKKHKKMVQHLEKLSNMDPESQHYKAIMKKKQQKQQEKEIQKQQQQQQQQTEQEK